MSNLPSSTARGKLRRFWIGRLRARHDRLFRKEQRIERQRSVINSMIYAHEESLESGSTTEPDVDDHDHDD